MSSRYGVIEIANSEGFSHHPNGFGVSPYLQEQLVYLGQLETYQQGREIADKLLGLTISTSQIYRLTTFYGQAIEAHLDEPLSEPLDPSEVVYAQADGAMLLTEEGYKENKLARLFKASDLKASVVEERGGHIASSLYTAHLGPLEGFSRKLRPHLDPYQALGANLVILSDGAIWLGQLMQSNYGQATHILDFYHAISYLAKAAQAAFGTTEQGKQWIEQQRACLLKSELKAVLRAIETLDIEYQLRESIKEYLSKNAYRMDYQAYRQRGLLIGSGAIESAHRTVVHKRLKRAGQRWTIPGAQQVLNLRVCQMSNRWNLVRFLIEPFQQPMAA
jgi:hypothetical protein